jgi:hypothetical protein
VELFNRNVSAKLLKSLTILQAQPAGEEEIKVQHTMCIAGIRHILCTVCS